MRTTPAKRRSISSNGPSPRSPEGSTVKKSRLVSPEKTQGLPAVTPPKSYSPRSYKSLTPREGLAVRSKNLRSSNPQNNHKDATTMSIFTVKGMNKRVNIKKIETLQKNSGRSPRPYKLPVEKATVSLDAANSKDKINNLLNECENSLSSLKEKHVIESEETSCSNYFKHRGIRKRLSSRSFADMNLNFRDSIVIQKYVDKQINMNSNNEQIKKYKDSYDLWKIYLSGGFNILFFGLGYKDDLLENFCQNLDDADVLFINSSSSQITVKDLLCTTAKYILDDKYEDQYFKKLSEADMVNAISKDESERCLYIAICNIDRQNWRSHSNQLILSSLAACSNIRLIATVDHINASALWDMLLFYKFKWMTIEVNTLQPPPLDLNNKSSTLAYKITSDEESKYVSYGSALAVFSSVPSTSQQVFLLIANRQQQVDLPGFTFQKLKIECSKKFLSSSDASLKSHLRQFVDHRIIELKKDSNGNEIFIIRLSTNDLNMIIENTKKLKK